MKKRQLIVILVIFISQMFCLAYAKSNLLSDLVISEQCNPESYEECSDPEKVKLQCMKRPGLCDEKKSRFTTYQPNYAIFQATEDDETSMEVNYSFKWLFTRPHCMKLHEDKDNKIIFTHDLECLENYNLKRKRYDVFFTYTGKFDFYVGSRNSGPVVNRVSNPAFHYRKIYGDTVSYKHVTFEWFNVGFEHRSNGQVIDADVVIKDQNSPDNGKYKAQVEYENQNHEYFDSISRGSNYLSLEIKANIGDGHQSYDNCSNNAKCFNVWLSGKIYATQDSDVLWGPEANQGLKFSDYDRVKLIVADKFGTNCPHFPSIELGVEWTVGDKLLDTDSFDFNFLMPLHIRDWKILPFIHLNNWKIPFYIRAHTGPMSTLSDYTKEQDYIGFGVRFR